MGKPSLFETRNGKESAQYMLPPQITRPTAPPRYADQNHIGSATVEQIERITLQGPGVRPKYGWLYRLTCGCGASMAWRQERITSALQDHRPIHCPACQRRQYRQSQSAQPVPPESPWWAGFNNSSPVIGMINPRIYQGAEETVRKPSPMAGKPKPAHRAVTLYSPEGSVHQIPVGGTEAFCRAQGLEPAGIRRVLYGQQGAHKGWRGHYATEARG